MGSAELFGGVCASGLEPGLPAGTQSSLCCLQPVSVRLTRQYTYESLKPIKQNPTEPYTLISSKQNTTRCCQRTIATTLTRLFLLLLSLFLPYTRNLWDRSATKNDRSASDATRLKAEATADEGLMLNRSCAAGRLYRAIGRRGPRLLSCRGSGKDEK